MPEKYQLLITSEIKKILRDYNKPSNEFEVPLESPALGKDLIDLKVEGDLNSSDTSLSSGQRRNSAASESRLPDNFDYDCIKGIFLSEILEYSNECTVDELVHDAAVLTNRGIEKANEWLAKLKSQDIMTVGDLRDLHEEDWINLNLTVFASRALKNMLFGKGFKATSPKLAQKNQESPPLGSMK